METESKSQGTKRKTKKDLAREQNKERLRKQAEHPLFDIARKAFQKEFGAPVEYLENINKPELQEIPAELESCQNTVEQSTAGQNTVERSTAEQNTVERSTAEQNTVEQFTAEQNTVERSTAEQNTVEQNTAEQFTADRNTDKRNTAEQFTADRNTDKRNTAEQNTDKRNTVEQNTVEQFTADRNTVEKNTSEENTAEQNTAEQNTVEKSQVYVNNKEINFRDLERFLYSRFNRRQNAVVELCIYLFRKFRKNHNQELFIPDSELRRILKTDSAGVVTKAKKLAADVGLLKIRVVRLNSKGERQGTYYTLNLDVLK